MVSRESMTKIESFIRMIIQPNADEWDAFARIVKFRTLKNKDLLLQEGQVCNL